MRAADLDIRDLLDVTPGGGVIRFAGQRAVILDTVALGLLRAELIATLGLTAARGILTRFGYAHGWRSAETMKDAFPWDDEREWRIAGGRLHRLQGMVLFEPVPGDPKGPDRPFAESIWKESYEAEQHVLAFGHADEPVCWTLCGFASGYLSACNGHRIICVEEKCRGRGDTVCSMVARPATEWGDAHAELMAPYNSACLNEGLRHITEALRETESKLKSRRAALGAESDEPPGIVARSEAMRRVLDLARRVARVDSTVLVTGESGVGKEVVARFIHDESERLNRPFVALNCGAVPEGLLESELFGHARGAFTGAAGDRPGLFEAANGGTLFLDEIGDVPAAMQVKLLRALQEREVRRVGENKNRKIDVRVVAATNRSLTADVASGRFRQDLYYRLRVIEIAIPALRDRKEDVLPLSRRFLAQNAARLKRSLLGLTPASANQLVRYGWPGNVRELENVIERAVVLARRDRVEVEDLPEEVSAALPAPTPAGGMMSLADMEREYILAVLQACGGNKARAAERLGIGAATLFRKLKQYGNGGLPEIHTGS